MGEDNKGYLLLEFMCGEKTVTAQQSNSDRLLAWAQAFEAWIAEKDAQYTRSAVKQAKYAWRLLLQDGICAASMPWDLRQADLQAHVAWMEKGGYTASTIAEYLRNISNFYQYCGERRIDEPGFNPAAGVQRSTLRRFATARIWSQVEVDGLLDLARRDQGALGKRDHAFLLARLQVGVPTRAIRRLQWGQLRQGEQVQVRWRPRGTWTRFPDQVWAAIISYLEVSGRLAGMHAGHYIFAPIAVQGSKSDNTSAVDWAVGRCIAARTAQNNIKLYGRALGIPEPLLNLEALRSTAIRLQLDAGKSIAEMQVFLDSQVAAKQTRFNLKHLPPMPLDRDLREGEFSEISLPNRKPAHFQPGHGLLHGYYLKSQPPEGVLAVIAEGIEGIEEEMIGLRVLARGLVERQVSAERKYTAQLADAHSRAAARVSEMIQVEKQLTRDGEGKEWAEDVLERVDTMMKELGEEPVSDLIRAEEPGEIVITSRNLVEEIAATRYMLRRVLALAVETQPVPEYVHLVDIYGSGCVRLVKMLKRERGAGDRLARQVREVIHDVFTSAWENWAPVE